MSVASNYIANWADVVQHVLAEYPKEACGIVNTENVFIPYPNLHADPLHFFELDSAALVENEVKAIIHSHTYSVKTSNRHTRDITRCPSYEDQEGQIVSGVEWGVVVTDGEGVDAPIWWGDYNHTANLMDREFIAGAQDCLTFISDWLFQNKGIELPRQPHTEAWFVEGKDYMSELYESWGFEVLNSNELEAGDLVMFRIRSDVVNHLGIYVGNGQVAHHFFNRMPQVDQLGKWQGYIERTARYNNDNKKDSFIR